MIQTLHGDFISLTQVRLRSSTDVRAEESDQVFFRHSPLKIGIGSAPHKLLSFFYRSGCYSFSKSSDQNCELRTPLVRTFIVT